MFFALTDEQRALAATVRDFLADRFDLTAVRAVFTDPDGDGHPPELWKAIGEQGWLAVCVPARFDGLGLGLLDAQIIARAFGAGVIPGPWLPTVLAGEAVRLAGSADQAAAVLAPLAAGDLVATVALRGPGGGYDHTGIAVRATAGGRLGGVASGVEYLEVAGLVVVAAVGPAGVGLYLLDPRGPGVTVTTQRGFDGTTRLASLSLADAAATRLPASDAAVAADLVRRGALLTAADLVGVARAALTRTVAHDIDRVQFGRPVGSFQALAHHLADLHVAVTMAEHAVLYAAHALDTALPDAELALAVAKSKANQAAGDATAAMIQYHGGIGYTWEHDAHFFYKRAKRQIPAFGDTPAHLERIAVLTVDALP
ncbi:acyl-CoA dehydrogenase [Frankia casuarinae]|uniref:Acyl-CoA dehydrogenase-like n=1 Tax=Frankia casuarinae (strain DSM 45818 / CECT 9043 / HFP020203 / CcI3) TaxID=106370 RepID=Q2JEG8_FRACC|nr:MULTISPECIES: acyl-CoA dehydrogenase family protein [Frankia]ABD10324.1 acyl-CoA dehydrogenase-like [Frankia casuarinae]ETA01917.1 acyl-CoA dehydrogenase [Frankia sp. CcI6]EYT92636.1 acyl-CoA dehydrogenase [Frankia casuarinae]KDA41437.1 acyl-CoA dehydrogenase [Frankia sp. BMG5.23]KEZ38332.1 acyl-CoA dehydrogenase [Frankia sp. CeD]